MAELWTHENDVRAAVHRPSVPDAATLRLMTELAVAGLPVGVRRAAPDADRVGPDDVPVEADGHVGTAAVVLAGAAALALD